jgi:hypothetical protein
MKKISLLVIFTVIGFSLFAQTENKPAAEPLSGDLLALQTANSLARYGYSAQSASALIGAAEILAKIQTQPLGVQAERRQQSGSTEVSTPEFTPAALLADARRIAGRDATMIAWADEVQRSLNTRTRGVVGGPRSGTDVVSGRNSIFYQVGFVAGQRAEVIISGNGASDLDLYIYDSNGNLISYDEGYSDDAFASWVPRWTGQFTIEVRNCGPRANRFVLYTN